MKQRAKRTHRWLAWLLVWTMMGTTVAPYTVQPTTSEQSQGAALLEDALRLYEELEWDLAIEKLKAALAAGLDASDRAEAYWYLAVIARANDELKAAEDYMVEVFRAKPDFALPETLVGTDFEPLFEAALGRADRTPPKVRILSLPKEVQRDQAIHVIAEVSDDSPIVQVKLSYQPPDADAETVLAMKQERANRWSAEIPSAATKKPGELSYQVSAQDDWQNVTPQSGTIVISKGGGGGIFYVIGGAIVAVGGGVAALVLGSGGSDGGGDDDDDDDDDVLTPPEWPQSASPLPPEAP